MRACVAVLPGLLLLLLGSPVSAQQAPPGCTSAEHAQFDFWVGTWTVSNAAGATIGSSTVERASSGCALLESWLDANGVDGHSINFYDPASRTWNQVWMGSDGSPLRLEGALDRPGRMVLFGAPRTTPQGTVRDRISWTLGDDGSVEQLWETSTDDGASWHAGFRGIYRRSE